MAHPVLRMLTLVAATGVVAAASAQSLPTPAELPSYSPSSMETVPAPQGEGAYPMQAQVAPPERRFSPLAPIPMEQSDALALDGLGPAITESSGSWLRRGLWYADVDAVVMSRTWDSDGKRLIEEYDSVSEQTTGSLNAFDILQVVTVQRQTLGESSPGYDGAARLALGRFLFRDQKNRDHTFEMVVFGGPEWRENLGAEAQLNGVESDGFPQGLFQLDPADGSIRDQRGLHVPPGIDGSGPLRIDDFFSFNSFDRAQAMDVEYSSRFHSWEWNYSMAQRMRKDRMELKPSGEWVRRASPGFTWDYTAGLRYFDVEERMDWYASDIASVDTTDGDTDGFYDIDTSNNLFGLQLGAGLTYETDRWNVTLSTKQGFYVNDARATTSLTYTDPDGDPTIALNNYQTDLHVNGVSYLAQGSIMARYHLRPNLSLRAGWEFMYVSGLALAPNQANFNPAQNQLHVSGDAFYHGVSAGTEYYW